MGERELVRVRNDGRSWYLVPPTGHWAEWHDRDAIRYHGVALGAVKVDDVRALVAAAGLTTWEQLLGAVDALRALQEASHVWREDERDAVSVQDMHRAAVATARARVDAIRAGQVQS